MKFASSVPSIVCYMMTGEGHADSSQPLGLVGTSLLPPLSRLPPSRLSLLPFSRMSSISTPPKRVPPKTLNSYITSSGTRKKMLQSGFKVSNGSNDWQKSRRMS